MNADDVARLLRETSYPTGPGAAAGYGVPTWTPTAVAAIPLNDEAVGWPTPQPRETTFTELGNAEAFVDLHGHRFRYVPERRAWHVWLDGRWRHDVTGEAERASKEVARELLRRAVDMEDSEEWSRAAKWAHASQFKSRIAATLMLAGTEPEVVLAADALDRDPWLLACANGTLDLRTGQMRPHDPGDLISLGTEVAYEANATCPRWEQFLAEVFGGDEALIGYVHRAIGYSLTGDTREQLVFIAYGLGCNGKDTLFRAILRLLGDLAIVTPAESFTRSRGDKGIRNDLARMHRARLVLASESGDDRRLDEATVKLLSGGGKVAARFLHQEFFEYEPRFKLFLVTNHKPRVDADDEAIWRRVRLIPFTVSFRGREDKTLAAQLEHELPGILNWAVEGCLLWQRDGLGEAPAVTQATAEYRAEGDVVGAFIAERCDPGGHTPVERFRSAFAGFCDGYGEPPLKDAVLGKRLAAKGIRRGTRDTVAVYLGVTVK